MTYNITVLPGDGIGPEVTRAALSVLKAVSMRFGFDYRTEEALVGGAAIDETGRPLPDRTVAACHGAHAVFMGSVGGPKWDNLPVDQRPEQGLLSIRAALKLYANLRPATVHASLIDASPLKNDRLGNGLDILIVRELTGGIYFGSRGRISVQGIPAAFDTEMYTEEEIERVAHVAFSAARGRQKRLCLVDKANVLESSRLWRETVTRLAREYPKVELTHMYVDNAAMQLLREPRQFDVILTSNMFGDILSDEASQISGSIGLLPSASLGAGKLGLYEPVHGSAPDIAGQNKANPLAAILSLAMMLRYSLDEEEAAVAVEQAVERVLESGARTADLAKGGEEALGTEEMGELVARRVRES